MRWLVPFYLALTLLFAQQGAMLHALSHLSEPASSESHQDKRLPHSPACEKCVAFAQMDGGMASTPLAIVSQHVTRVFSEALPMWHAYSIFNAYLSRAPPSFLA